MDGIATAGKRSQKSDRGREGVFRGPFLSPKVEPDPVLRLFRIPARSKRVGEPSRPTRVFGDVERSGGNLREVGILLFAFRRNRDCSCGPGTVAVRDSTAARRIAAVFPPESAAWKPRSTRTPLSAIRSGSSFTLEHDDQSPVRHSRNAGSKPAWRPATTYARRRCQRRDGIDSFRSQRGVGYAYSDA